MPASDEAVNVKGRAIARAKAAAYLPPVKLMQRGATTPSRAERGGCGGSLEDELCPNEIQDGLTLFNTLTTVLMN